MCHNAQSVDIYSQLGFSPTKVQVSLVLVQKHANVAADVLQVQQERVVSEQAHLLAQLHVGDVAVAS
jgi:hypothetical protein